MAGPYRLHTLGELRLEGPAGEVRSLRRKERLLLAYLARRAGSPVRRAELAAALWGDHKEASARHALRQALFSLRRELGDALEVGAEAVRLLEAAVALDVQELEAHLRGGRYAHALGAAGQTFLDGLEDAGDEPLRDWIELERRGLRALLSRARDGALAAARASGHWDELIPLLRRIAEAQPVDDAAQASFLEALSGAGRFEEALAWHTRAVERLRVELGVEPSAGFLGLAPELAFRGDPALVSLLEIWRGSSAGTGAVVWMEAEDSGLATALCERLAVAVGADEAAALILRAPAAEGVGLNPAWGSAAQMLAPLRRAPGLSAVNDTMLAEVATLVPAIRERFRRLPDARGGPHALAAAVTHTLAEVATEVPVLLLAGAAAALDAETRAWLVALAVDPPAQVLLVLMGRPGELEDDPLLHPLAGAVGLRTLRLQLPAPSSPAAADLSTELAAATARREGPGLQGTLPLVTGTVGGARHTWLRRRTLRVAAATAALLGLAMLGSRLLTSRAELPGVLAVGAVRAVRLPPEADGALAMPELLTTQLTRIPGLSVVGRARFQELRAQADGELSAARAAGADQVLEGELHAQPAGGYRLELRRVDARTGRVREVYQAEAVEIAALPQIAAAAVARSFRLVMPPEDQHAPPSIAARALYEQGLRAYYQRQDFRDALRLFTAALEFDSSFAMAALYAANSELVDPERSLSLLARAEALARHAPERDRLYIRAYAGLRFNDPGALAPAESLATRYPGDPSGVLLLGSLLHTGGRFAEAVAQFRKVLGMEAAPPGSAAGCTTCEAYAHLIAAYMGADSVPAALAVAREWAGRQPENPSALAALSHMLDLLGRYDEATPLWQRVMRLRENPADLLWEAQRAIRRGDFAAADRGLDYLVSVGNPELAGEAAWLRAISLRNQGRYREAWLMATQRREVALGDAPATHPFATPQAVVLMETGRAARAAAMFDTMFHTLGSPGRVSWTARNQAWLLTLQASALAAAGDTARLARLADSVRVIGALSGLGRDPRLHHHIRGLLLRARGDHTGAEREFRAAIFSTVGGYTRSNLELARLLTQRGRAIEAVPLLEAALRAPLDGSALYVTRTELQEALGLALDAAGQGERAAVHYRQALAAWSRADWLLLPRLALLRRRVAELEVLRLAGGTGQLPP
jgi:DNA-binding SARP family transcriptional activator